MDTGVSVASRTGWDGWRLEVVDIWFQGGLSEDGSRTRWEICLSDDAVRHQMISTQLYMYNSDRKLVELFETPLLWAMALYILLWSKMWNGYEAGRDSVDKYSAAHGVRQG